MCLHKWEKWKDKCKYSVVTIKDENLVGYAILQEKRCIKCNKVKLRYTMTRL